MAKSKNLNFEESLFRLEEITQKMESGDLTLDESLKLFEEGVGLSRFCEKKLINAETKVKILQSTEIEMGPVDNQGEINNDDADEEDTNDGIEKIRKKGSKKKELLCESGDETEDQNSFLF